MKLGKFETEKGSRVDTACVFARKGEEGKKDGVGGKRKGSGGKTVRGEGIAISIR